jgi:hypothetical protein
MDKLIEQNYKMYLIDSIEQLKIRFTGKGISNQEKLNMMSKPLKDLEIHKTNLVMMHNMYPLGWN